MATYKLNIFYYITSNFHSIYFNTGERIHCYHAPPYHPYSAAKSRSYTTRIYLRKI